MPYTGTCINGPMDGRTLRLRRLDFIAVYKPDLLYWVYRGDDDTNTFTLDLTITPEEEAAGLNADGTWDGRRPFTHEVQKEMWVAGLDVVAVPPPWPTTQLFIAPEEDDDGQ